MVLLYAPRDHEVKAMWEWLQRTGRKLEVIGMMGPLQQVRLLPPRRALLAPTTTPVLLTFTDSNHAINECSIAFEPHKQFEHSCHTAMQPGSYRRQLMCKQAHLTCAGLQLKRADAMDLNPPHDLGGYQQSVGFIAL